MSKLTKIVLKIKYIFEILKNNSNYFNMMKLIECVIDL